MSSAAVEEHILEDQPRKLTVVRDLPDRIFKFVATGGGVAVLVIMLLVGLFLALRASNAISASGFKFLTTQAWDPDNHHFGVAAVLVGTVLIALVAITIAVPLSTCTALFLTEYASPALRTLLIGVIDLMAAIPSVVYGLWGFFLLQAKVVPVSMWISKHFGWIPIFKVNGSDPSNPIPTSSTFTSSTLIAGLVVGMMVTPVITSIMREVFSQVPIGEREAALGLGATRWGVIQSVVLPFGKGGMIGGTMLGLGRALGETIAVLMIVSPIYNIQFQILHSGGISVSSLIALRFGEANAFGLSALMAAGLTLFLMTLVINFAASSIVARSRSGASS